MKDIVPDWFETSVTQLTSVGTQRVWSVLVTIFGDLAQEESDQISGSLISTITGLSGIKAEATRVALHRLRKEGWIESIRTGRNSVHRLTEYGRQQTLAAVPLIYAQKSAGADAWHIVVADSSDALREELSKLTTNGQYTLINSVTAVSPGVPPSGTKHLIVLPGDCGSVPTWLKEYCGPQQLNDAYGTLLKAVETVRASLPRPDETDAIKTAVLRVLVVHNWRRIVLRHPLLPAKLLPKDWKGFACRDAVSQILVALPRPSLRDLESSLGS